MFIICLLHADIRCSLKDKMHLPDDIPNLPYTTKENPSKKEKRLVARVKYLAKVKRNTFDSGDTHSNCNICFWFYLNWWL